MNVFCSLSKPLASTLVMVNIHSGERNLPSRTQLKAARAALDMTVKTLAEEATLGVSTIRRAEDDGLEVLTPANARRLIDTFSRLGVLFLDANEDGPGIRIRQR